VTSRHRCASRGLAAVLATLALLAPSAARADCDPTAQLGGCVNADNLWPHAGPGPFLARGSTLTAPAGKASFGLVLSYLSRPIGLRVSSADPAGTVLNVVDNAVNATFLWSLGIADRLELTLAAPLTLYQDGAGLGGITASDTPLPRSTMRDVRFGSAFAIVPHPRAGSIDGFSLLARMEMAVPAGDAQAFAGGRTLTWFPSLVGAFRHGRFEIGAEIGARLRGETRLANAHIGSQLSATLGASFDVLPSWLTVSAEAFGLYTLATQEPPARDAQSFKYGPPLIPAEWILSATTAPLLGGDVSFTLAGGGPIPLATEAAVTAPRFRFDLAVRYAPTGRDADADGVLDRDDRCPKQPEDRDGFQDADGCPDPDNDNDRIPDVKDRCRDAAETVDGFQDDDGCPDLDDDNDGIKDENDRCRNEAEDKDNFQDDDGCPDPDNDGDGIPDVKDRCPNGPEDKDGFKDDDGCPDPDNDLDQVPDADDRCPEEREDLDGFQDQDGCPEPDNDEDGVLDRDDRCPLEPETIDGKADEDGCPEPSARSVVHWAGDRAVADAPLRFPAGSDKPGKPLEEQLRELAQLVRGHAPVSAIIVEGFADRPGDESPRSMDLAEKRAQAVKAALVAAGLPEDHISAATGDPNEKRPPGAAQFDITVQRKKQGKRR
jgi:outer membrane protein OmpA-like peptidoglycan-associated protein